MLLDTHQKLVEHKFPIPPKLQRNLVLVHSYLLARRLSSKTLNDSKGAARMLIRVCKNVSMFPMHVVPILTSCVYMCMRAGLKRSAHEWSSMLMQPEYKNKISEKYKAKIVKLVRKAPGKEPDEETTPCPVCGFSLPNTLLDCPRCRNSIPYCIASGRHMVLNDWTQCPSCKFPALHSVFSQHLAVAATCPMCSSAHTPSDLTLLSQAEAKHIIRARPPGEEASQGSRSGTVAQRQ